MDHLVSRIAIPPAMGRRVLLRMSTTLHALTVVLGRILTVVVEFVAEIHGGWLWGCVVHRSVILFLVSAAGAAASAHARLRS